MRIGAAIAEAERGMESFRVSLKASDAAMPNPVFAAAGGPAGSMLGYDQRLVRHSEQYKHNVGWTFTAVHRIATRFSDQPARVGRLLPPDASEYVRSWAKRHGFKAVDSAWRGRFGRRLLSAHEREYMPRRLKSAPGEYEIIDTHPILATLADPNAIMTASTLYYSTVASFELTGKAFWWWPIEKGEQRVYHLPSDWVTPKHTDTAMYVAYDVKPPGYFAESITVPAEEITPFLLPDPSDPHRSISPAQTQAPAIAADEAIQIAQARQFANDMYPGLILKAGRLPGIDGKPGERPVLTRSQRKALIEAIRAIHEGVVNYREPFIVDGLIEGIERMTYAPQEMDYLQSGQSTKSRIMQAFGVNPFLSGENVTIGYAQASVAEDVFLANVINPLGRLMGEAVSKRLKDEGCVFWFEEAVPRNPDLKLKKYTLALNNQVEPMVSREEFRREVLQLADDDGDDETEPSDVPEDGPTDDQPAIDSEESQRALPPPRVKMTKAQRARCIATLKEKRPRQAEFHEHDMERAMGRFFRSIAKSVLEKMDSISDEALLGGAVVAELLFNAPEWSNELKSAAAPPMFRAAVAGYETAKALFEDKQDAVKMAMPAGLKIAQDGWDPSEGTFLEGWDLPAVVKDAIEFGVTETLAQPYWQKILATTGDQVGATLRTAAEEQWDRTDLKHQIMRDIGDTDGTRSRLIARTEMTGAMNIGHMAQSVELEQDYGLHTIRIWVSVGDPFVRETHVDADGQEVPGQAPFIVGGYECQYPGDWDLPAEERCNCILPGNEVQGSFIAGTKAWYEGKAVEVITAGNRRLSLTPEHRVLTEHGFIRACSLKKGDKVLAYDSQVDLPNDGDNIDQAPSPIEQVFDALRFRSNVGGGYIVEHRSPFPTDFHGDGQRFKGQVQIVRPDGELVYRRNSVLAKKSLNSPLNRIDAGLPNESAARPCYQISGDIFGGNDRLIVRQSSGGFPCGGTLTQYGFPVAFEGTPFEPLCIGSAANLDLRVPEDAKKDGASVAKIVRKALERFAGNVPSDKLIAPGKFVAFDTPDFTRAFHCDTGSEQVVLQGSVDDSVGLGEFQETTAGTVLLDDIVEVRYFDFRGHVYDLQSTTGLIIAEGIAVSNCRCTFVTDLVELREGGFTGESPALHGEVL